MAKLPPRGAGVWRRRRKRSARGAAWQPVPAHVGSHRPLSAQVELLVMKALSAGLVKGSIDEVDKRVLMTWVQPRVLDLQQVTWLKCMVRCGGIWVPCS